MKNVFLYEKITTDIKLTLGQYDFIYCIFRVVLCLGYGKVSLLRLVKHRKSLIIMYIESIDNLLIKFNQSLPYTVIFGLKFIEILWLIGSN